MSRSFSTNIKGKVRNFHLPKNRPLVPLYEAIVNSINAIDERRLTDKNLDGNIKIQVLREKTLFAESENDSVVGFKVIDNGIGFTNANMNSFMEADSDYKLKIGGKGVGRFSWLKAFSNVEIKSTYQEKDGFLTRAFTFSLDAPNISDEITVSSNSNCETEVYMDGYKEDFKINVPKQLNTIAKQIIQHCFAYFLRNDCPKIRLYDSNNNILLNELFADGVKADDKQSIFTLGTRQFSLSNIKIVDKNFVKNNRLFLCASERLVYSYDIEGVIPNLDSNIFEKAGYWYVGILKGDYLDENVDMNRLSFNLPQESSSLFPDTPGLSDIESVACEKIKEYLREYLIGIENAKKERIKKYTTEIAPQYRHLLYYVPDKIADLKPNISDEKLDDALYNIKRDFENETKKECNELMKKLDGGDITSDEYQSKFKKTIEKVSDVNRAALADYIVHRRIILNLFDKGLNIRADGKFNLEKYMHNLIYPMRHTSDDIPYENHNLWLLDEKLSFCQFISSDKPFDNVLGAERTDIMFLDSPIAVADDTNNGTAFNSIIIFELKRPMRNDYDMQNNPVVQLIEYAKRIRGGNVKDSNHRIIKVTDNTQFYLYALCDITPTLESVLDSMSFTKTPDKLGAYFYNDKLHAYIEVVSFDKVRNDAEKRNRVLFEKLGL